MAVTACDIAKELGISQSTVSRVLSGSTNHRISAQTRDLVLATARSLNYRPNAVARSLKSGRTNTLGLFTSQNYDARNDFLAAILGGIQNACARHNLDLLLHIGIQNRSAHEIEYALLDGRIDGLIVHATDSCPDLVRLRESGLPTIAIADRRAGVPAVHCDDAGGMKLLLNFATKQSYSNFIFVKPAFNLDSVEIRLRSWRDTIESFGFTIQEHQIITIEAEDAGALAVQLASLPQKTLVSCWNDRTAYSLLRACISAGISVPGSIGVTGFDGFADDKVPACVLTTAECRWDIVASKAVDLLACSLASQQIPDSTILPVSLIEGGTV